MDFDSTQFLNDVLEKAISDARRTNRPDASKLVRAAIEAEINYVQQELAKLAQRNYQALVDGVETKIRNPKDFLSITWKRASAPGTEERVAFEQELSARVAGDTDPKLKQLRDEMDRAVKAYEEAIGQPAHFSLDRKLTQSEIKLMRKAEEATAKYWQAVRSASK